MADQKISKDKDLAIAIVDDWPEDLPVTALELELFESELLDIIKAMIQHG